MAPADMKAGKRNQRADYLNRVRSTFQPPNYRQCDEFNLDIHAESFCPLFQIRVSSFRHWGGLMKASSDGSSVSRPLHMSVDLVDLSKVRCNFSFKADV